MSNSIHLYIMIYMLDDDRWSVNALFLHFQNKLTVNQKPIPNYHSAHEKLHKICQFASSQKYSSHIFKKHKWWLRSTLICWYTDTKTQSSITKLARSEQFNLKIYSLRKFYTPKVFQTLFLED